MDAGWGELKVNALCGHELFEGRGTLIVKALEFRAKAGGAQLSMESLIGG
jgi:hypothetical protein